MKFADSTLAYRLVDVLSISSLKGGVGKTTIALGLASSALSKNLRTLIVDVDPQSDVTTGLAATATSGVSVANVLSQPRPETVRKAIVPSAWTLGKKASVDVMVGSPSTIAFDSPTPSSAEIWHLDEALSMVEQAYDLVLIDCPPSLNALTRNAWVASDRILLVSEPSLFAVSAVGRALKAMQELGDAQRISVLPFGVLINRYRSKSLEHQYRVKELKELYPSLILPMTLPERASLQQAQGAARPVHGWPSESAEEAAQVFDQTLERFLSEVSDGARRRGRK